MAEKRIPENHAGSQARRRGEIMYTDGSRKGI